MKTTPKLIPVDTTCKSCRYFSVNVLLYPKHANVGLGHCKFTEDRGLSVFTGSGRTCDRYDATDKRKAYLAARAAIDAPQIKPEITA